MLLYVMELVMRIEMLKREAEKCRREAATYSGKPEAAFLMHVASSFEELAARRERLKQ